MVVWQYGYQKKRWDPWNAASQFKKVQEESRRIKKVQEDSRRLNDFLEGSTIQSPDISPPHIDGEHYIFIVDVNVVKFLL